VKYTELVVWQKAMDLVEAVYKAVQLLPAEERYALSDQLRRASVSVPSNIAEGAGRKSTKEYIHFLNIARGSVYEVETQLLIAKRLGFISQELIQPAHSLCEEIEKMISTITRKLGHNEE